MEAEPLGRRAILYSLGNLVFKAILSSHGSNQNKVLSPFPTLKSAKASTLCHCLEIFIQGLLKLEVSLPLMCHSKAPTINLHLHLARRSIFLIFSLSRPRPPSPWASETKSHLTRWINLLPLFHFSKKFLVVLLVDLVTFSGIRKVDLK